MKPHIADGLSFGYEEEFLLLLSGRPLAWPLTDILGPQPPRGQWSFEAHEGMVEHSSPVFDSASALVAHLTQCRGFLGQRLSRLGIEVFAAGAHPTLDWRTVPIRQCYRASVDELQELLRHLLTLGMHCHIGSCPEPWLSLLFNALRPFLAPLIALSANSRHYAGRDTGLASYRGAALGQLPRGGTPPRVESLQAELDIVAELQRAGMIHKPTSIWTDARLHPTFHTIEIRVMDMQPCAGLSAAIAALCCLLARRLLADLVSGEMSLELPDWQLRENRWQAVKHGLDASLFWQHGIMDARSLWQLWLARLEGDFAEAGLLEQFFCLGAYVEQGSPAREWG